MDEFPPAALGGALHRVDDDGLVERVRRGEVVLAGAGMLAHYRTGWGFGWRAGGGDSWLLLGGWPGWGLGWLLWLRDLLRPGSAR